MCREEEKVMNAILEKEPVVIVGGRRGSWLSRAGGKLEEQQLGDGGF